MWKFLFILLLTAAFVKIAYFSNFDFAKVKNDLQNNIKNEKTIKMVTDTRQELNQEAQDAMNK